MWLFRMFIFFQIRNKNTNKEKKFNFLGPTKIDLTPCIEN